MTQTSSIEADRTLAALVEETPAFARAFESLGLDYCCGGDRTLAEACSAADLDVESARAALADVETDPESDDYEWETLAELADHVVETHHDYLREELPALETLVTKVSNVHGETHPELQEVETVFLELAEEMREHIEEEETELFPILETIDRGESPSAEETERLREAIRTFEDEHAATADRLDRIAALTDEYVVPEDACASYRSTLDRLERLERDTHVHVHKENNVLFTEVESRLDAAD